MLKNKGQFVIMKGLRGCTYRVLSASTLCGPTQMLKVTLELKQGWCLDIDIKTSTLDPLYWKVVILLKGDHPPLTLHVHLGSSYTSPWSYVIEALEDLVRHKSLEDASVLPLDDLYRAIEHEDACFACNVRLPRGVWVC